MGLGELTTGADDARRALAEAIRMLAAADVIDYSGHASLRRDAESFFINAGASVRSTLGAHDIVAVDLSGNLVEGAAKPPLEFHIHSAIYRARADVSAIIHTHPKWSTYLSMTGVPYQPVFGQGALLGDVPVLDSTASVNTTAAGERLAEVIGSGSAALLRAHGAVIVGGDLVECFALTMYLEENAHRQYMAMQIGRPYVLTETERQACRRQLWSPALFRKAWDHFRARL
jgi:ribulose-5-phosphate 4-epimerase/fuculose-1-phosphate aldolase